MNEYMRIDPRGPSRKIVTVIAPAPGESVSQTRITKDCGHTSGYANHFTYKVGASLHCFQCRDARDNTKPEYICTECKGAGQICTGDSGTEADGYAPILERCEVCGGCGTI